MSNFTFNPSKYGKTDRPGSGKTFKPLPEGWYDARIKDITSKPWDDGGFSLQVTWEVTQDDHKGRLIWQTLNLKHRNEAKSLKAKYMLADICTSVGHHGPLALGPGHPPKELVNEECAIELILLPAQLPSYPQPKNFLRAVRPIMPPEEEHPPSTAPAAPEFDDDDIPF